MNFSCFLLSIVSFFVVLCRATDFSVVVFALHFGPLNHAHFPLVVESMGWNPSIRFILMNIYTMKGTRSRREIDSPNFEILTVDENQFNQMLKKHLGISSHLSGDALSSKLKDYRPWLPLLSHDFNNSIGDRHWGFFDINAIFGNIEKFIVPSQGNDIFLLGQF